MPDKTEIKTLPTQISKNSFYNFTIEESGLYLIEIIASCKNWRQNWKCGFNDDDLAVKIDDIEFPKLNGKNGLLNGEAAWNGNNLKGSKKIGIFILKLESGEHKIDFKFFPYTVSYDNQLPEIAFGVMQISKKLFLDL